MNTSEQKKALRAEASLRRDRVAGREEKSARILERVFGQSWMNGADLVSCYVSFRAEVETHALIRRLLDEDRQVCVPWCDGDDLRLTAIRSLAELRPRTLGLLEPPPDLRSDPARAVLPQNVAVFLVPGLAFTPRGDRIGYGRGYYDRLLASVPDSTKAGLAFEEQIVERMPITPADVRLDYVVTEERVCSARR